MNYISLSKDNIESEHICCAFSDKKCSEGYELKKQWLNKEFKNGFIFRRLDERAKVFIEYCPAEKAWIPVTAPNYMMINCFWVSGKYKGHGHGKALLQLAVEDAEAKNMDGLVTVVGSKKYHFMSDAKWLQRQGFEVSETTSSGFALLSKKLNLQAGDPSFKKSVTSGECTDKEGFVVYYSNRCPYSEYHVQNSLTETIRKRKQSLKVYKFETRKQAQASPTPATIFSLFYNGKFVTTDISICMDSRFDKILAKNKSIEYP